MASSTQTFSLQLVFQRANFILLMAERAPSQCREINEETYGLLEETNVELKNSVIYEPRHISRFVSTWKLALALSMTLNLLLGLHAVRCHHTQKMDVGSIGFERSDYGPSLPITHSTSQLTSYIAGLKRNIVRPWTPLHANNQTEQDAIWENTRYDIGQVALSDNYAKSKGLPRAQRFPWDHTKGVYLINAYHNLHCVKTIRTALLEFRSNSDQSSLWGDIQHCLLVLRDKVICNADDVPRYTGFQENQSSGLGQYRMCRDFSKLEDWALQHTACWRHIGEMSDQGFRELDRYRFCPEGSPYMKLSEEKWLEDSSDWWQKYKIHDVSSSETHAG